MAGLNLATSWLTQVLRAPLVLIVLHHVVDGQTMRSAAVADVTTSS